jgi:hypothetical protein
MFNNNVKLRVPFRSVFLTTGTFTGPDQSRLLGIVLDHNLESSFAVEMAEFLVQQKIIIGFLFECLEMMSGSLLKC